MLKVFQFLLVAAVAAGVLALYCLTLWASADLVYGVTKGWGWPFAARLAAGGGTMFFVGVVLIGFVTWAFVTVDDDGPGL